MNQAIVITISGIHPETPKELLGNFVEKIRQKVSKIQDITDSGFSFENIICRIVQELPMKGLGEKFIFEYAATNHGTLDLQWKGAIISKIKTLAIEFFPSVETIHI